MFRRIAAAFALIALVAMGFAAPAAAGPRGDASSARAGDHDDQAVVASPVRRARERAGARIDGRPDGIGRASTGLVRLSWLATVVGLDAPGAFAAWAAAGAPASAAPGPALASRTSRGPPARS